MSYQAIQTKYLGPTNCKGSRYKAWCQRGSIIVGASHELNQDANHAKAADLLKRKFVKEDAKQYGDHANPWARNTIMGWLPDGSACHVYPERL